MRFFVTFTVALGLVGVTATVGSAQIVILNPLVVLPAQPAVVGPPARPEIPQRVRPEGQVHFGPTRLNWRVALTMGTLDAKAQFVPTPDSQPVTVAIPIPVDRNGFRWRSPGTLAIDPALPSPYLCQAELQFCVGGVVWVPQITTRSWRAFGVFVLKIPGSVVDLSLVICKRCALFNSNDSPVAYQFVK